MRSKPTFVSFSQANHRTLSEHSVVERRWRPCCCTGLPLPSTLEFPFSVVAGECSIIQLDFWVFLVYLMVLLLVLAVDLVLPRGYRSRGWGNAVGLCAWRRRLACRHCSGSLLFPLGGSSSSCVYFLSGSFEFVLMLFHLFYDRDLGVNRSSLANCVVWDSNFQKKNIEKISGLYSLDQEQFISHFDFRKLGFYFYEMFASNGRLQE